MKKEKFFKNNLLKNHSKVLRVMKGGNAMEQEERKDMAGTLMAISVVTQGLEKQLLETKEGENSDGDDETATTDERRD